MLSRNIIKDFRVKLEKLVQENTSIILTAHLMPDDDAIGSTLAFYSYFKKTYPKNTVKVVFEGPVDIGRYGELPYFSNVEIVDDFSSVVSEFNLLIMIDAHCISRITVHEDEMEKLELPMVKIDHHRGKAGYFVAALADPDASSTAEIVYQLVFSDQKNIDKDDCELLFLGIDGDTNGLMFISEKNAHVFNIIARLVAEGKINVELFRSKYEKMPENLFGLVKILFANTKIINIEGWPKFAYSFLPEECANNYSYLDINKVMEEFHHNLKKIQGVNWDFLVYPRDNKTGLSMRSTVGSVLVRPIAEHFDGGGHDFAAGAHISNKSVQEVKNEVLRYLKKNNPIFS